MYHTRPWILCVVGAGLLLAGCGSGDANVAQKLGLDREAPDEFTVVSRAPLSVPPDFTLRPPRPGADRPMEMPVREQARQTVFGAEASSGSAAHSAGQQGFLSKLGAGAADPTIREQVDSELGTEAQENKPVAERLLFWNKDGKPEGKTIDPVEEKKRIEAKPAAVPAAEVPATKKP